MNHHNFIKTFLCFALLVPAVCSGQNINGSVGLVTTEVVAGETENRTTNFNLIGPGTHSHLLTARRSSTYARGSTVADAFALRFSAKATGHGGILDGATVTDGGVSAEFTVADSIIITSPSVPSGAHSGATARIRLLFSSQRQLTGTTNPAGSPVGVSLHSFQSAMGFWSTNSSSSASLPNGEILVDMPAIVDGPNPPYQANFLHLIIYAQAHGNGTATTSSSISSSITVTWGGIVSLKLADNTVLTDFSATGASGADYRNQRARTDQAASIGKPATSTIALQWAGTSNIFYQVESSSSLEAGSWSPMGEAAECNGTNAVMESILGMGNRFYRVVDAPLP